MPGDATQTETWAPWRVRLVTVYLPRDGSRVVSDIRTSPSPRRSHSITGAGTRQMMDVIARRDERHLTIERHCSILTKACSPGIPGCRWVLASAHVDREG